MECPQCGLANPPEVSACTKCKTPLPDKESGVTSPSTGTFTPEDADETLTGGVAGGGSSRSAAGARRARIAEGALQIGSVLADRYEILQPLGEGGMGAVYKVRDRELDRFVAVKVIRPALVQSPDVLNRFKQELIIARQVTHRNVSRIYDLAEADGVKFITMEFVEGRSLGRVRREKGKLAPKEAAGIIVQVCHALEAAHAEGVIHRDLKPQNIMLEAHDRVIVMDFGIARRLETRGITMTGEVLGTPAYMSPEQAKGEKVDARSDLFSLGIIFYELLTGDLPHKADTELAAMYKRTTAHVRPPIEIAPEIPKPLSEIVVRCLEIDKDKRYASATEILRELEPWAGTLPGTSPRRTGKRTLAEKTAVMALGAIVVMAAGVLVFRNKLFSVRPAAHREVSGVVVGSIGKDGSQYSIHVKAIDGITGKDIVNNAAKADKQDVLSSIGRLSADVRTALGDTTPESVKLSAQETFTAESLEAAHSYAAAQDLQQKGKWDEAIKEYQHATQLDANFGRAFAGLAAMEHNLGRRQEAEKNYKLAFAHIDRMTDREKYRTRGGYYLLIRDQQKAIEEYTSLMQQYPADAVAYPNLAMAYFLSRNMAKAQEIGRHSADLNPTRVAERGNVALYALYAGDFANAAKEAQAALKLNPKYEAAVRALALAQLGEGQDQQAAETYKKLAGISTRGASMAATGSADLALYEGRTTDAVHILEQAITADLAANDKAGAGGKQAMLAEAELALGHKAAAAATAEKAIATSQDDGVEFIAAGVFIESGKAPRAKAIAAEMGKRLEPEPQVYAKLIEGELQLLQGDARIAIQISGYAQKLADCCLGCLVLERAV